MSQPRPGAAVAGIATPPQPCVFGLRPHLRPATRAPPDGPPCTSISAVAASRRPHLTKALVAYPPQTTTDDRRLGAHLAGMAAPGAFPSKPTSVCPNLRSNGRPMTTVVPRPQCANTGRHCSKRAPDAASGRTPCRGGTCADAAGQKGARRALTVESVPSPNLVAHRWASTKGVLHDGPRRGAWVACI
jgi:hypothetical protein